MADDKQEADVVAEDKSEEPTETKNKAENNKSPKTHRLGVWRDKLRQTIKRHPRRTLAAVIAFVVLVITIGVIPATRYGVLGLFIKKNASITLTDSLTHEGVSGVKVRLAGKEAETDNKGTAQFDKIRLGQYQATAEKKNYESISFKVIVGFKASRASQDIKATGIPVSVKVVNTITGKPVENAVLLLDKDKTVTDKDGLAEIVLALNVDKSEVELSGNGFNKVKVTVTAKRGKDVDASNILKLAPVGNIYFLSKQSGKIDVVSTNLDGTDRQVVLAGTGNEDETGTILLASRDWKYLALLSVRDNNDKDNKIYLIETSTNKLTTIDEGNAYFTLDGWLNDKLVYRVTRNDIKEWQSDKYRLKAFDASTKSITVLDKSTAIDKGDCYAYGSFYTSHCYVTQGYVGVTITNDEIIFGKQVSSNYSGIEGKNGIYGIKSDGTGRRTIVEVTANNSNYFGEYLTYKPNEIYYQIGVKYFEYEIGGKPKEISSKEYQDNKDKYVNFVVSPNGKNTLWAESRDGKNTLFIGNLSLEEGKEIAKLSELKPYGWFTEDYLLLSKNGSELYIMSRDGGEPVKVSDYHKPNVNYNGYGYGYGGN